jgi:hypothetical protein
MIGVIPNAVVAWYDWDDRDYAHIEHLVTRNITKDDWVFCDWGAYYPAKQIASEVFTQPGPRPWANAQQFGDDAKGRISVLIVKPSRLPQVVSIIGGNWEPTGDGFVPARSNTSPVYLVKAFDFGYLATPNYDYRVYRRVAAGAELPKVKNVSPR